MGTLGTMYRSNLFLSFFVFKKSCFQAIQHTLEHSCTFYNTFCTFCFASVFRLFTHQTRHLVSSFNMENDQRIEAHLLRWFPAILKKHIIFGLAFFASVFRLFTHQTRHLVLSFNVENDQRTKTHLLRWFPAILYKYMVFGLAFLASVFRPFTY